MKPAFIWDLDGTLLDSYGLIVDALYRIYEEKGVVVAKEEIYKEEASEACSLPSFISLSVSLFCFIDIVIYLQFSL